MFGPHPRSYAFTMPKKARRAAMKSALSSKVLEHRLLVLEALQFDEPKTREMAKVLKNLKVDRKALVVTAMPDEIISKSARNIEGVKAYPVGNLNVYDVLRYDKLVITKDAIARVEEVLA